MRKFMVRFMIASTRRVHERAFDSAMARTMFVVNFEREGLGTVLEEWTVEA